MVTNLRERSHREAFQELLTFLHQTLIWVVPFIVFMASYLYCIERYGFLLGFGLGWLPSGLAALVAYVVAFAGGLILFGLLDGIVAATILPLVDIIVLLKISVHKALLHYAAAVDAWGHNQKLASRTHRLLSILGRGMGLFQCKRRINWNAAVLCLAVGFMLFVACAGFPFGHLR